MAHREGEQGDAYRVGQHYLRPHRPDEPSQVPGVAHVAVNAGSDQHVAIPVPSGDVVSEAVLGGQLPSLADRFSQYDAHQTNFLCKQCSGRRLGELSAQWRVSGPARALPGERGAPLAHFHRRKEPLLHRKLARCKQHGCRIRLAHQETW